LLKHSILTNNALALDLLDKKSSIHLLSAFTFTLKTSKIRVLISLTINKKLI